MHMARRQSRVRIKASSSCAGGFLVLAAHSHARSTNTHCAHLVSASPKSGRSPSTLSFDGVNPALPLPAPLNNRLNPPIELAARARAPICQQLPRLLHAAMCRTWSAPLVLTQSLAAAVADCTAGPHTDLSLAASPPTNARPSPLHILETDIFDFFLLSRGFRGFFNWEEFIRGLRRNPQLNDRQ